MELLARQPFGEFILKDDEGLVKKLMDRAERSGAELWVKDKRPIQSNDAHQLSRKFAATNHKEKRMH